MRHALLSALLFLSPPLAASAADVPAARDVAATQVDLEVAEIAKDGTRRAVTLTLTLPDRHGRTGSPSAEVLTRVAHGERGDTYYYRARVEPEQTTAGTRYSVELRRAGDPGLQHPDLRVEVARVLTRGVAAQLGRVARPDGTALVITATLR